MCLKSIHQIKITKEKVNKYRKLAGDHNPIHFYEKAAQQAGFSHPIAYGLLTMGLALDLAQPLLEKGLQFSTYDMQFIKPVYINELLTIHTRQEKFEDHVHIKILSDKVAGHMILKY